MILKLVLALISIMWVIYIIYKHTPEELLVLSKIMKVRVEGNSIKNETGQTIYTADHNIMYLTSDGQIVASSYMYSSKRTARTFDDRIVAICSNTINYAIITELSIDSPGNIMNTFGSTNTPDDNTFAYKIYLYDAYTDTNLAIMTYVHNGALEIFGNCSIRQGKVIVPLKRSTLLISPASSTYIEIPGNTIYTDIDFTIIREGTSAFRLTDSHRQVENSVDYNLVAKYGDFRILEDDDISHFGSAYSLWYKDIVIHTDIDGPFNVSYYDGSLILNGYIYKSHLDIQRTDFVFCMV